VLTLFGISLFLLRDKFPCKTVVSKIAQFRDSYTSYNEGFFNSGLFRISWFFVLSVILVVGLSLQVILHLIRQILCGPTFTSVGHTIAFSNRALVSVAMA